MKQSVLLRTSCLILVLLITLFSLSYASGSSPLPINPPTVVDVVYTYPIPFDLSLGTPNNFNHQILQWNGYTYWAYCFGDGDYRGTAIVAYDTQRNPVERWDRYGLRNPQGIRVDPITKTVSFEGDFQRITLGWDRLQVAPPPAVVTVPNTSHPAIPAGLQECALKDPNTLDSSPTDPVLQWKGCTYWAYSYDDNRYGMAIVAYDTQGNLIERWDKIGARYVWRITVDKAMRTVSFWGQRNYNITMSLDELQPAPMVTLVPTASHPAIPAGLKESAKKGPNTLDPSPADPVLQWNGYTYWAYSYDDNRPGMAIVAYDTQGNLVERWDKIGARYIWQITVDKKARTVSFWGQGNDNITMSWNELR